MKNIHKDLELITEVAIRQAKDHNCNYNIIISNHVNSEFGEHSTYEYVADSFFEKDRPNCKLLETTDNLYKLSIREDKLERILVDKDKMLPQDEKFIKNLRKLKNDVPKRYEDFCNPDDISIEKESKKYMINTPFVRTGENTQRNDICSCGSGKKYKKCCINS